MLLLLLLAASAAAPAVSPSPPPPPLRTIIIVHSSALCTIVADTVVSTVAGLRANDNMISVSKPVLLNMGKELEPDGVSGDVFDKDEKQMGVGAAGTHQTNPALVMNNERLYNLAGEIVHNLKIIDAILNEPNRFPAVAKTEEDKVALQLKARLEEVAAQQRKTLNLISSLEETFSLQDLIAKGDGTQGVIDSERHGLQDVGVRGGRSKVSTDSGYGEISHHDQDVSFLDVLSGVDRGSNGAAVNPTTNTNPAITQRAIGLSDNPMARFYEGVAAQQQTTGEAEDALAESIMSVVKTCK
jgi:hypothetical protein